MACDKAHVSTNRVKGSPNLSRVAKSDGQVLLSCMNIFLAVVFELTGGHGHRQ